MVNVLLIVMEVCMFQRKSGNVVSSLVALMQLEESAKVCTTRLEAQACILEADATKRHLWGTTEGTIAAHL